MRNPIEQFRNNRKTEIDNLIIAVLVATGVNLLVSGISMIGEDKPSCVFISAGLVSTILAIIVFITRHLLSMNKTVEILGFFLYDVDKKELLDIPQYFVSLVMCNTMMSASDEIKKIWKERDFGQLQFINGRLEHEKTEAHRIITELIEYFVLEQLSISLIDFYNKKDEFSKKLKKLQRDDMPDVIQNRFLYWLSQKPEKKSSIKDYIEKDGCTLEEAFMRYAEDNTDTKPYSRFEIVLPKNTNIIREKDNIWIKNSFFSMKLNCSFEGNSALIPTNFKKYYLNIDDTVKKIKDYQFKITVEVRFKFKSIVARKNIEYLSWIDSFLNNTYKWASSEHYFKTIEWSVVEAVIDCCKSMR